MKEPDNFISNNPNEREAVQVLNELFLEAALTRSTSTFKKTPRGFECADAHLVEP